MSDRIRNKMEPQATVREKGAQKEYCWGSVEVGETEV
jgi:hypothetical protein